MNIPSATPLDHATIPRRVWLVIAGTLPEPAEIRAFLADPSSTKRARKIDEFFEHPGHTALGATKRKTYAARRTLDS